MTNPPKTSRYSWFVVISWLLFVGWAIVVLWASLDARPFRPLVRLLAWDKLQHAGAYAVLTLFGGLALRTLFRRHHVWPWITSFFFSIAYGLSVEVIQHYLTRSRRGDVLDFLADVIGSFVILCVVLPLELRKRS